MSKTHYLYLRLPVKDLEKLVEAHQEEFETLVGDTFSEDELLKYEKLLDTLSTVEVQPILSELRFDDLYPEPQEETKQRVFFESCKSCICLDHLPYFESHPFQVTYLIDLLWTLDEVLVDRGGVQELQFKKAYIDHLKKFKTMDSLLTDRPPKAREVTTTSPVHPMDFLVLDVYKELGRIGSQEISASEQSEKLQKILSVMKSETLDADGLLKKSGLNAKDFGDHLERLKFFLKKI